MPSSAPASYKERWGGFHLPPDHLQHPLGEMQRTANAVDPDPDLPLLDDDLAA